MLAPGLSIWSAALIAATPDLDWQVASDHLECCSSHVAEPLGIRLSPGEILEVRWHPSDTAYTTSIRRQGAAHV